MSINLFFVLILGLLVGMFGYFKPHEKQQYEAQEVPQFELEQFVIYEITSSKIDHFFEGEHGKHFENRYEISGAKFTNNAKPLLESIRADEALYKEDVITLKGHVHYSRADGLAFRSSEGIYDQNRSLIQTKGPFVITKDQHRIEGSRLNYDLVHDTTSADQVRGSYQLH
ncbi:MAG: LPS export ABC transporter periplasmic protein LptC [Sulfuricurvum sp.]|nr:LPS export ABC transporter periplasmic protein LptC [Sulfuricurvum sp.]